MRCTRKYGAIDGKKSQMYDFWGRSRPIVAKSGVCETVTTVIEVQPTSGETKVHPRPVKNEKFQDVELIYFAGISNLASKFGQIGLKWDKSGTF